MFDLLPPVARVQLPPKVPENEWFAFPLPDGSVLTHRNLKRYFRQRLSDSKMAVLTRTIKGKLFFIILIQFIIISNLDFFFLIIFIEIFYNFFFLLGYDRKAIGHLGKVAPGANKSVMEMRKEEKRLVVILSFILLLIIKLFKESKCFIMFTNIETFPNAD